MVAEKILNKLEGVRKRGSNSWLARCPAHDDHDPSLSIRETEDGMVLIYCFTGCEKLSILDALGLDWSDLYPPRQVETGSIIRPHAPPFPWGDFLQSLKRSLMTTMIGTAHIARGNILTQSDLEVLIQTAASLHEAIQTIEAFESGKAWSGKTWK